MRKLHFYLQSVLVLLALMFAVQIPGDRDIVAYVALIEIFLLFYQTGMGLMLMNKLTKQTKLQFIHIVGSIAYLALMIALGISGPNWMEGWWMTALFVVPWVFIILFIVVIDGLEYARGYR